MSKSHRGSGLRETPSHGRGTCPVCKRSGIKVVYERERNSENIKVCKPCNAALKREKTPSSDK